VRLARWARGVATTTALAAVVGCTTDLLVGEDTDGTGGSSTGPGDGTAAGGTTAGGGDGTGAGSEAGEATSSGTTMGVGATSDDPSGTSTGVGETASGEAGATTTGEPLSCGDIVEFEVCTGQEPCIWIGRPGAGECTIDPCQDPMHECLAFDFAMCGEVLGCAWNSGDPKVGDCLPITCVPCELLSPDQCPEVEGCMYSEGEMACLPL
jgi:hypothetical protein